MVVAIEHNKCVNSAQKIIGSGTVEISDELLKGFGINI